MSGIVVMIRFFRYQGRNSDKCGIQFTRIRLERQTREKKSMRIFIRTQHWGRRAVAVAIQLMHKSDRVAMVNNRTAYNYPGEWYNDVRCAERTNDIIDDRNALWPPAPHPHTHTHHTHPTPTLHTWTQRPPFWHTTFSNSSSWMKDVAFSLKFLWILFLSVQLKITHWQLVWIMDWCRIGDWQRIGLLSESTLTRLTDAYMRHYVEMS